MSFRTVEGAEKHLSPSLESEAAPQGPAEFHVTICAPFTRRNGEKPLQIDYLSITYIF